MIYNRVLITWSILVIVVLLPACGGSPEGLEEEPLGVAEEAAESTNELTPNSLVPNSLVPNSLVPNSLIPNELVPNALAPSAMSAITDSGTAGAVSRLFLKYLVGCALDPAQSFAFSWTDTQSVVHNETYWGQLGIAYTWTTSPLGVAQQKLLSACLAARANYYGISVVISLRSGAALTTDASERSAYPAEEGAFWGNIFSVTPSLRACHNVANISNSRTRLRDCAAGHLEDQTTTACGIIEIIGSCDTWCDALDSTNQYRPSCVDDPDVSTTAETDYVVSVFLPAP